MKNAKHYFSIYLMVALMVAIGFSLSAQNYTWVKKANMPEANYQAANFTIGNKVYVVSGVLSHTPSVVLSHHVWQYDPSTNGWTQMNDFPGTAVFGASSFVIGNYGYVVNGWDSTNSGAGPPDCWQYDPSTDSWTAMAPFPGSTRYTCSAFAINGKGYVSLGFKPYVNDTWEFDPVANTWTQKSNFPGTPRQSATCFTIGNYEYIGGGDPLNYGWAYFASDWYRYDPSTDTWAQLNYFPGAPQLSEGTFVMNGLAYVVCGVNENQYNLANGVSNDIWQYNPTGDSWTYWGAFPDTAIGGGDHVSCNGLGFFGQGEQSVYGIYSSAWWSFGQQAGPYSCAATIAQFFINNATSNFEASGNFSPSAILSWNFGDGGTGTGTSVIHQYAQVGTYIVNLTITDTANGGCSASVNDTITITNISNCSVTMGNVHIGSQYTLYASPVGDGPYSYVWSSPTDTAFNSTSPDPTVILQPNTPATFCVTITDTTGCSASACDTVTYVPSPDSCQTFLSIVPDPNIPGLYYAYVYHTGATPVSYYWTFGDGGTSIDSFPGYTYQVPGYYDICLTITDSLGCVSTFCDTFMYAFKTGGGEIYELNAVNPLATGIHSISQQLKLGVFPNPASTQLIISAAGQKVDMAVIYDVDGQRISQIEQPANNKINIANLADGIYFIAVTVQGQTARVKFVKAN